MFHRPLHSNYPDYQNAFVRQKSFYGVISGLAGREASKTEEEPSVVEMIDTEFENSPSRITLLRDFPETRIVDRVLGPYHIGQEIELPLWVAQHLVHMGYAKFREDEQLTLIILSTTHYKETLPGSRQIAKLSRSFYFQVRRLLKELKSQEAKDRNKARDLDKALALARDIVAIRVKKIASLSASGEQTTELTSNLTAEEQILYEKIRLTVEGWRKDILGREDAT